MFQFLCVVTKGYERIMGGDTSFSFFVLLLEIERYKRKSIKKFQFLCVVTFRKSLTRYSGSAFQFLCVVTSCLLSLPIHFCRFQFLCVVTYGWYDLGGVLLSFSFFVLLRYNESRQPVVLGVLVSLCCYWEWLFEATQQYKFQFLCVVTFYRYSKNIGTNCFSFFVLLLVATTLPQNSLSPFQFLCVVTFLLFYVEFIRIYVLVSLCCYLLRLQTRKASTGCFSFFVLLLINITIHITSYPVLVSLCCYIVIIEVDRK